MRKRVIQRVLVLSLVLLLALTACAQNTNSANEPADNALVLRWVHSTSIADWANAVTAEFNSQNAQSSAERPIFIQAEAVDAGQAVSDMLDSATTGVALPELWTPPDISWLDVLDAEAGSEVFLRSCVSAVESPLVIAMWEPVARALGWPGRDLGWLDIASLAADPSGWNYYSGGQFGETLRIGHTHPGLSGSGVHALLSMVYATESSPASINLENVENPMVQASVGAFESAVAFFASDTQTLSDTMRSRGPDFLNAAVLYENEVIMQGATQPGIVAIYPFEGTFVADFPSCIRAQMDDERTEAAGLFLGYLVETAAQEQALNYGLRPVDDSIETSALIDERTGISPSQPDNIFAPTSAENIFAMQELWQDQRKDVNLAMVLDVSGSMEGAKLEQMRLSAVEFVRQMGDDDRLTVIIFYDLPETLVEAQRVGGNREAIINAINGIRARGSTALYDAIMFGARLLQQNTRAGEVNAMVALTDGQNTSGVVQSINADFNNVVAAANASVYTIAYGGDADRNTLASIALATNGIAYVGDVSNIADIYAQISAAFGGSLGIGR